MEIALVMFPFLAALIVLVALPSSTTTRRQQRRLAVIERKLDLVMEHLGIVDAEPDPPEVVRALEQGRKVAAVKAYQKATGADLVVAKDAVDALAARRGL